MTASMFHGQRLELDVARLSKRSEHRELREQHDLGFASTANHCFACHVAAILSSGSPAVSHPPMPRSRLIT